MHGQPVSPVTEQPIRVLVELAVERTEITNEIAGSTSREDQTRLDLDHKLTALESRIEEQVKAALPNHNWFEIGAALRMDEDSARRRYADGVGSSNSPGEPGGKGEAVSPKRTPLSSPPLDSTLISEHTGGRGHLSAKPAGLRGLVQR